MGNYVSYGIEFTINADKVAISGGGKFTNSLNMGSDGFVNPAKISKLGPDITINAIDIDWNGAELKNNSEIKATLNTTGEVLSMLKTA